jgi:hypothetical protein
METTCVPFLRLPLSSALLVVVLLTATGLQVTPLVIVAVVASHTASQ